MSSQTYTINTKIRGKKTDNLNLTTKEILTKIKQTKEGFEIITRKNQVVPHFDYDFYYNTEREGKNNYASDIERITNELKQVYDLDKAKIIILPSCGIDKDKQKKGKPSYKNSINIILRGVGCFKNNEVMPKPQSKEALYDKSIYGTYQKLRLPFTSKQKQNRFKNLQGVDGTIYTMENFKDSGFKYADLLVSNVKDEILREVKPPKQTVFKEMDSKTYFNKKSDIIELESDEDDIIELESDEDEECQSEEDEQTHIDDKPERFKTPKHFKLLLNCLLIERIDNLDNWLIMLRICKNILFSFDGSDIEEGRHIIHSYMKKTPNKYKFVEVEAFLNQEQQKELTEAQQIGFGSLAKMAREDNEPLYLQIIKKVFTVKKSDIFNIETVKNLRKEPRKYFWSDFGQFKDKRMKNANEVLKYLIDSNFVIINGGVLYYIICDNRTKKMTKTRIVKQSFLERKKNHPFQNMKNMCYFWIGEKKYSMFQFASDYFNKHYFMQSEMLPYSGPEDPLIYNENLYSQKILNKFEGFDYARYNFKSKQTATIEKFLYHISNIICGGDVALYNYVISYLADIIQNPERKPEVCLLLQGQEGAGKNILVELIKLILGTKYCFDTYQINDILGGFNVHLSGKLLVVGDELIGYAGFKKSDFVKGMITSPNINITRKGVDTETEISYHRYIFTTNNFETLRISNQDRRICVIAVSNAKIGKFDYFKDLKANMNKPDNIKMMFDYLMKIDLSNWNFRRAPITKLKMEMVISQLDSIYNWFAEFVETQTVEGEELRIKANDAIEHYKEFDRANSNIRTVDFKRKMTVNLQCSYKRFTNGRYFVFNVKDTNNLLTTMLNLDYEPIAQNGTGDDGAPYDSEDEN